MTSPRPGKGRRIDSGHAAAAVGTWGLIGLDPAQDAPGKVNKG